LRADAQAEGAVRKFIAFAPVIAAFLILVPGAAAQDRNLLPEAQAAFDRGLAAVDQQQWGIAARHFGGAQRLGGSDPRILLNLGLAHAKANQELHGILWLNAYLDAAPDAANAKAVREEIGRLKQQLRVKIDKILSAARSAADKLPNNNYQRDGAMSRIDSAKNGPTFLKLIQWGYFDAAEAAVMQNSGFMRDFDLETLIRGVGDEYSHRESADFAHAVRLSQLASEPAKRTELAALVKRVRLLRQVNADFNHEKLNQRAIEELVSMRPQSAEIYLRTALSFHLKKGNFSEAERVIDRMIRLSSDYQSVTQNMGETAYRYLEAGRKAEAAAMARKLQAYVIPRAKADNNYPPGKLLIPAKAILGDYAGAAANARPGLVNMPHQIYSGVPDFIGFYRPGFWGSDCHFPEFATAGIVLAALFNGRADEAQRIAASVQTQVDHQAPQANFGYFYLKQGQIAKAIEVARGLPGATRASGHQKGQLLGLIVLEQIKRGDLKGAEETVRLMPPTDAWNTGARYRVEALLLIADAYQQRKSAADVQRVQAAAIKVVHDGLLDPRVITRGVGNVDILWDRIAANQQKHGDSAGATATRDRMAGNSGVTAKWVKLFYDEDFGNLEVLDPEKRLAEIASMKALEIPDLIASVGINLSEQLYRIEYLEKQRAP
jgi:hypothetical protein